MRPVDPTTLRRLPSLRRYLSVSGGLAVGSAVLIAAQAALLSVVLAGVVIDGALPSAGVLAGFGAVVAARAGMSWLQQTLGSRAAATVKAGLRGRLLAAVGRRSRNTGETVTLITRGLDGLDTYITGYLPQLVLAATVPVTVLLVLAFNDLASLIIIAITLPLIPVFGILIGWHTKAKTERQWRNLSRLGGHFLDVIAGLSTLRIFGRAAAQAEVVRDIAHRYRKTTMETLRVAFLSALVLELVATVAVALVAVPIGLRLVSGDMDLRTAFLILLLAPEVYVPLRAMGSQFHAAQEGLTALDDAFGVLDGNDGSLALQADPDSQTGERTQRPLSVPGGSLEPVQVPDTPVKETTPMDIAPRGLARPAVSPAAGPPASAELRFESVTVHYDGRPEPALAGVDAVITPGDSIAIVGPSGAGKTTLLNLLLGFAPLSSGRITCGGTDLADIGTDDWLRRIAWVPQRAHLFALSVADNIRLGQPQATMDDVRAAAEAAYAGEFIRELPAGFDTMLGEEGYGLSAGQRRRLALARAFLRIQALDCPLVLLDEPTAGLDVHSETVVAKATAALLAGRTSLVVAHRRSLMDAADRTWRVTAGRLAEVGAEAALLSGGSRS